MKTKAIFFVILLFTLSACIKESLNSGYSSNDLSVSITGNSMCGFSNKSSRAATISQIPENGQIMFYSTGGIIADGDTLTLENGLWTGLKNDKWDTSGNDASIAAYYPVINTADLYSENGELQDMVWCKTTAKLGDNVNLSFSHMFAKLVINIESELNDTVKDVKVNIPSKISGIDFYTGEISFEEDGYAEVTLPQKYNGKYEIFIPASNECNITLDITCNKGKKYNPSINNSEYKAGYEYICNVKLSNKGKGIYTTEDFIAFTHLINGETEYNGRTLEEFYVMDDGKRVFNLYNDLSFTKDESENIQLIGKYGNGFNDVFNGNNHKLENIVITSEIATSYSGLFYTIAEESIIKNLILYNCQKEGNDKDNQSIFIGRNLGLVDNCHIINSNLYVKKGIRCGGFVFYNEGTIINSSISGIVLKEESITMGVFNYQNNGNIINCRIKSNFNKIPDGSSSSMVSSSNYSNIFNVFVEDYKSSLYGLCFNNSKTGQYYNCIMHQLYKDYNKHIGTDEATSTSLLKGISFYQNTAEEYQKAANSLNEWIDGEGKELYPTLTFRRWTTDPIQKVIFE